MPITTSRVALLAATAAAGATLAAAATPALAANAAKQGIYADNKPGRAVSIVVARGATKISEFSLACPKARRAPGTILLRNVAITSAGTFALDGSVTVVIPGTRSRKADVRISGTFQRGRVTGSLAPNGSRNPCDPLSFSARYFGAA